MDKIEILGTDLDDTLSLLHLNFIKSGLKYIEMQGWTYGVANPHAVYFKDIFGLSDEHYKIMKKEVSESMFDSAPVRPFASETLHKIREQGGIVYVITARSKLYFPNPYEFTAKWLNRNDIPFDKLFVAQENKIGISKSLGITTFVEDLTRTAIKMANEGIRSFLMETPSNANMKVADSVIRVKDWKEIETYLEK